MTYEKAHTDKPPLRSRDRLSIALAVIAASPGYLALLPVIISHVAAAIYGDYSVHPRVSRGFNWLVGMWFLSTYLSIITVPISLILALVATFLPLAKRAKAIIWLLAVGGGLAWFIAVRIVLGPPG